MAESFSGSVTFDNFFCYYYYFSLEKGVPF